MDFYRICVRENKEKVMELFPDFRIGRHQDLMVRGRSFYAIWDEEAGLWSTDEYDVQRLVDEDLEKYANKAYLETGISYSVNYLRSFSNNGWNQFKKFVSQLSDNSKELDSKLTFANTEVKKSDYVSRRLPYALEPGPHDAWDEMVGTLYSVEEKAKIEWAIGAIVSGDSKKLQKFLVLYGAPGTGKGTVINIVQKLFEGYTTAFEAKALGSQNGTFSTEVFKNNPLVAIQHDGDLSKIEDNTKLNSIISHEDMTMNEKHKPSYTARVNAFLLMGTNKPVKISDAKSGIIRRLIDVHPTGVKLSKNHYLSLMSKIDFELGAIAQHCLDVYREMGKNYYEGYRPLEMMLQTDIFFNYIEAYFDVFKADDGVSLRSAYNMYKEYCGDTGIDRILPQYKFREELRNYFDEFRERAEVDGQQVRSYYSGFNANRFKTPAKEVNAFSLVLDETESLLDEVLADMPAQTYKVHPDMGEIPERFWSDKERLIGGEMKKPRPDQVVSTTLKDLDTTNLHFVKVPENHIVIDFDLKDASGEKSLERNLEAASVWPATYAELSKSGAGVHLHYYYEGDVSELSTIYSDGIEVKTLLGDSSLRRRLSKCNNIPIAVLNMKLPVKEKKVLSDTQIKSERGLRELIQRNIRKEILHYTKPSIEFIKKILDDAYESGMAYDVTDMRSRLVAMANNSSNQAFVCMKIVQQMKFVGQGVLDESLSKHDEEEAEIRPKDDRLAFYDVEVYPNLFVIVWKFAGGEKVRMVNPTPVQVEALFKLKLVGYNCRRYDNHIIYARSMGYNNEQLYRLSKRIIDDKAGFFAEAYELSYADMYDVLTEKKSLKMWEVELQILHMELDIPWDEPVDEKDIPRIVEYCGNDVDALEKVHAHRIGDWVARQILADLSELPINSTTARHTSKIIFGSERNPQRQFVYTDLSTTFPGYKFDMGKSEYRGEITGEGGYVYSEPGIYENVVLLDVASMHPTSMIELNLFGTEFTKNFKTLLDARLAIKRKDYAAARKMLNGRLVPHLQDEDPKKAKALSDALKIAINTVYGLTSAKFDNAFRDPRNKDNIVAKRGALFMVDLKHFVQEELGKKVVHIKTDSIKIPGATQADIDAVVNFGHTYGYDFEHEATYEKFCLVNDAVYVAREDGKWSATGAQFQHPFVFKTLFADESVSFNDLCETKQVQKGLMYLDVEYDRPMATAEGMKFIGKVGRFLPVVEGTPGAGLLYRVDGEKKHSVSGTKGFFWIEANMAESLGDDLEIDMSYYEKLKNDAIKTIEKFGSYEDLIK